MLVRHVFGRVGQSRNFLGQALEILRRALNGLNMCAYGAVSGAVEKLLNKRSGVLGMSGVSADIRDAFARAAKTPEQGAEMDVTSQVYLWRIRKYLGAYLAVVGKADAVIFTDTIGETVPIVRWAVCTDMEVFGLKIDAERNNNVTKYPADVAADDSAVRILVIQTNEELAIARRTYATLSGTAATAPEGGEA